MTVKPIANNALLAAGLVGLAAGAAVATLVANRRAAAAAAAAAGQQAAAASASDRATTPSGGEVPAHIRDEVWSRNMTFFGNEGFALIRGSFVVVVGLGGVGSHAAHMLARSGCGALRVMDFDQVSLSSLNRHAVATLKDVGRPKAEAVARHLAGIVPWCAVDDHAAMFNGAHAAELLAPWRADGSAMAGRVPDFVVDCIDDVNTKADLIAYCQAHNLPVITACAAGAKADPTRLHMVKASTKSRTFVVEMRSSL